MKIPNRSSQAGFTMVELSVVLVVIGLILGVSTIGVNLQRSAQIAQLKHNFVEPWKIAYDQYYLRNGTVLGDNPMDPRFMVAGGEYVYEAPCLDSATAANCGPGHPETGGEITPAANPIKICQGQGYANYETTGGAVDSSVLSSQFLHGLMDRSGIRMPAGRAEGREDRFLYLDHNGNPQEAQICFQWFPAGTHHGAGNAMLVRGLTPEIARELDAMIDGKADASEGMFRQFVFEDDDTQGAVNYQTDEIPSHEWSGNATYADDVAYTSAAGASATSTSNEDALLDGDFNGLNEGVAVGMATQDRGRNNDEDRVMMVTAVWQMDQ